MHGCFSSSTGEKDLDPPCRAVPSLHVLLIVELGLCRFASRFEFSSTDMCLHASIEGHLPVSG